MQRNPTAINYQRNSIQEKQPLSDRNKENLLATLPNNSIKNLYEGITNYRELTHQRNRSDYQHHSSNLTLELLNDKINKLTMRVSKSQQGMSNILAKQDNSHQQLPKKIDDLWKYNLKQQQSLQKQHQKIYQYLSLLKEQIINKQSYHTQHQSIEKYISQTAKTIRIEITKSTNDFFKKYIQDINNLKNDIDVRINKIQTHLDQYSWNYPNLSPCSIKYPFEAIKLTQTQSLQASFLQQNKNASIIQKVYYLDQEGYLLDHNNYYLVDKDDKQVRLSNSQIQLLKNIQILT